MVQQAYNEWTVDINVETLAVNYLEFKFVALNEKKECFGKQVTTVLLKSLR